MTWANLNHDSDLKQIRITGLGLGCDYNTLISFWTGNLHRWTHTVTEMCGIENCCQKRFETHGDEQNL